MPSLTLQQALKLAAGHHQAGRLDQAEPLYRQVLQHDPNNPDALALLGALLGQRKQFGPAVELISRACQLAPEIARYQLYLAEALYNAGKVEQAEQACRRAVQIEPAFSDTHTLLGNLLSLRGRLDEASASYQQALGLNSRDAAACFGLGRIAGLQGQLQQALALTRQALEIDPGHLEARANLGVLLHKLHRLEEAIACYQQVIAARPDAPGPLNNLGNAYREQARLDEAIDCFRRTIQLWPGDSSFHSNLLNTLDLHPGCSAAAKFQEHLQWAQRHATPRLPSSPVYANLPDSDRPLRIGYVSADFNSHPVATLLEAALQAHDRSAFSITAFYNSRIVDAVTHRLRQRFDRWHVIDFMSDDQVAQLVRQEQIDVLVDLSGHTARNRITLFARRPAPVQVSYLGYQNTTGLPTIDYRLTDAWADPPGTTDRFYTEKLFRLPRPFFCYQPHPLFPEIPPLPATANGHITFASFCSAFKINSAVAALWSKVLQAVPGSKLLLVSSSPQHLRSLFAAHGIDPARIEFLPRRSYGDYAQLYNLPDIVLDVFPFNGHNTTCDALWMGIPVVTLAGNAYPSRLGVDILSSLGLEKLIADTPDQYVDIVSRFANDPPRLAQLRAELRPRMARSPLMDGPGLARELEAAYRSMWHDYCHN